MNMKNSYHYSIITLFLICLLQITQAFASPTVFQQLCEMNKYWNQHPVSNSLLYEKTTFTNHEALISFHLTEVEKYLRQNRPNNLSAEQLKNRMNCLDILHEYQQAGVFPKNTRHNYTIPYFIDDFNTACAVGHLIRETGFENVACRIANEMNYAYLEDMPYPEIAEWADLMGFEVDELKWIQPAYSPPVRIEHTAMPAACGSANGGINISVIDNFTQLPVTGFAHKWYQLNGSTVGLVAQTEDLTNMPSGLYKSVVVTNAGMYPVVYDLIGLGNTGSLSMEANVQNETCTNSKDGNIALNITGGNPPYSVRWYDQSGFVIGTEPAIYGLSGIYFGGIMYELQAPQYIAEVTDAYGCKTFTEFNIQTEHEATYVYANVTQPVCGGLNGIIELPFVPEGCVIEWSHDPFLTDDMAVYLSAGSYNVTVTNEFGCETVLTTNLSNENTYLIDLAGYQQEYCGQGNGELALVPIQNATYQWSHDPGLNTPVAINLSAGYYSVTVTDINGCMDIQTFYIYDYEFDIYSTEPASISNTNSTNSTYGSIELSFYPEEAMQYSWSHNALLNSNSVQNLTAGIYTVTVTNTQTGCFIVLSYEIFDEALLGTSIETIHQPIEAHVSMLSPTLLQVSYRVTEPRPITMNIFDLNGKLFYSKNLEASSGNQQLVLPVDFLPSGLYLLQLTNGLKNTNLKFVISR